MRRLRRLQGGLNGLADFSVDLLESCQPIDQETRWVIITLIQRNPPDCFFRAGETNPLDNEGGLAKTGGRGDQR